MPKVLLKLTCKSAKLVKHKTSSNMKRFSLHLFISLSSLSWFQNPLVYAVSFFVFFGPSSMQSFFVPPLLSSVINQQCHSKFLLFLILKGFYYKRCFPSFQNYMMWTSRDPFYQRKGRKRYFLGKCYLKIDIFGRFFAESKLRQSNTNWSIKIELI